MGPALLEDPKLEDLAQPKVHGIQAVAIKRTGLNDVQELHDAQRRELERIGALTFEQAKQELLQRAETEIRHEVAQTVRKVEAEAREGADRRAREVVALAIQRCAADHTAEVTVSVIPLPNDEMKGRIIGREGRNIRALESLTGVDLIIDDTPESVTLSSFDPIRREIAKATKA